MQSQMGAESGSASNGGYLAGLFGFGEKPIKAEKFVPSVLEEHERQKEKANFKGQFNIVSDPSQKKNPNDLTEAEFEEASKTYFSIKDGTGALKIDTSDITPEDKDNPNAEKDEFKNFIMGDIAKMMQTEQGRQLLAEMSDKDKNKHTTSIKWDYNSAHAAGTQGPTADEYNGVGVDAKVVLGGKRDGDHDDRYAPGELNYPDWMRKDKKTGEMVNDPMTISTDTRLFHELVHAHHLNKGTTAKYAVGGHKHPNDAAHPDDQNICRHEHQASGVGSAGENEQFSENKYRAEQRKMADQLEDEELRRAQLERYKERDHHSSVGPDGRSRPDDRKCGGYWD